MWETTKFFFSDTAGKFKAVKSDLRDMCRDKYDLSVYSLTPEGERQPTRLIMKMTPVGKGNEYLSASLDTIGKANVVMCWLDYQTFSAEFLKTVCSKMQGMTEFSRVYLEKYVTERKRSSVSIADFFGMEPRKKDPGTQIYLQDKAFFQSILPDPKRPDFRVLWMLTDKEKAEVTDIIMPREKLKCGKYMHLMFNGCRSVRQLDLSAFDTTGVISMSSMFQRCESLKRLDLSSFDFSQVKNLGYMFEECYNLEEVIFSDTVLGAGEVPHHTYSGSYTMEEINELYRSVYIAEGPQRADIECDKAMNKKTVYLPVGEATDKEVREYLGLRSCDKVKITIVPHRAVKKG